MFDPLFKPRCMEYPEVSEIVRNDRPANRCREGKLLGVRAGQHPCLSGRQDVQSQAPRGREARLGTTVLVEVEGRYRPRAVSSPMNFSNSASSASI